MNEEAKKEFLEDLDELRKKAREMAFHISTSYSTEENMWIAVVYHLNATRYIVEKQ